MGITLVRADWSGSIPGFDAGKAAACFFMHDPTVRRWISVEELKGTVDEPARILIADDDWVNPGGGIESLTFPVGPRDLAIVQGIRARLVLPPHQEARSDD